MSLHIKNSTSNVEKALQESELIQISPTTIGRIIKSGQCPRFSKLDVDSTTADPLLDSDKYTEKSYLRLLFTEGEEFEEEIYSYFEEYMDIDCEIYEYQETDDESDDSSHTDDSEVHSNACSDLVSAIESAESETAEFGKVHIFLQFPIRGEVGPFSVFGQSDVIFVAPTEEGVELRVFDIKASWEEKTHQQIQIAAYSYLLQNNPEYDVSQVDVISGGVIHKENYTQFDSIEPPRLSTLPVFDIDPREDDIERLLSKDSQMYKYITKTSSDSAKSEIDSALNTIRNLPYQLDSKCENCQYRDICITEAVESVDISLLGITQGVREAMNNEGIYSLYDLSDLTTQNSSNIKPQYKQTVEKLRRETGIEEITNLSLQAGLFLEQLDPSKKRSQVYAPKKKNSRYPETIPKYQNPSDMEEGWEFTDETKGIKVYLNVQYDYISDCILQLSARIIPANPQEKSPTNVRKINQTISHIPTEQPHLHQGGRINLPEVKNYEKDLLESFIDELYTNIEDLSNSLGITSDSIPHFYLYSQKEHEYLIDSADRYTNSSLISSFRELLGVRRMEGGEQQLWGYIEDDLNYSYLFDRLPTFLPAVEKMFRYVNKKTVSTDPQKYSYNNTQYNLLQVFQERFFNYKRNYTFKNNCPELDEPTEYRTNIPYYSLTNNSQPETDIELYTGSQVPLEYFWGCKEFDLIYPDTESDTNTYTQEFMYTTSSYDDRITIDHLQAIGSWIVDSLEVIETEMAGSFDVPKSSMDMSTLRSFTLDSDGFKGSLQDYVSMEHTAQRQEMIQTLEKPPEKRVKEGKAIPLIVTNVITDQSGNLKSFEGKLAYDQLGFSNPDFVQSSSKLASGEYIVFTPLEDLSMGYRTTTGSEDPLEPTDIIDKSPEGTITRLQSDTGFIKIRCNNHFRNGRNSRDLLNQEFAPEDYQQSIFQGQMIILDEQLSTRFTQKTLDILDDADQNSLYQLLEQLYTNKNLSETDVFDTDGMSEILDAIENIDDDILVTPNTEQNEFVKDLSQISVLQGPPGTGKTTGSLANAIVSRAYTPNQHNGINGLITGPSNKSVDEVLESVAKVLEIIQNNTQLNPNIELYRINKSDTGVDYEQYDSVTVIHNTSSGEARELVDQLETTETQLTDPSTLVFATPYKIHDLLDSQGKDYVTGSGIFDLYVADESSMLTIPKLLESGGFTSTKGQILLTGDHRQMSPVQRHEWLKEKRPNIQKYIPYLSALNYARFLAGKDVSEFIGFPEKTRDSPNADIPIHQLEITYRCHSTIADFLQEWVYSKDGINYRSNITETIDPVTDGKTDGITQTLNENPFIVITHSDTESQESNIVESIIIDAIMSDWGGTDTGVISPHNAQKGLLRSQNVAEEIDTVERFQGGERDIITISSTVSDPTFIKKEDDFLLNPNRINVAISRMKQKVILIVPESVFEHIPTETDTYNDSKIWNGLYNELIKDTTPDWSGSLQEFSGESSSRNSVTINVYGK